MVGIHLTGPDEAQPERGFERDKIKRGTGQCGLPGVERGVQIILAAIKFGELVGEQRVVGFGHDGGEIFDARSGGFAGGFENLSAEGAEFGIVRIKFGGRRDELPGLRQIFFGDEERKAFQPRGFGFAGEGLGAQNFFCLAGFAGDQKNVAVERQPIFLAIFVAGPRLADAGVGGGVAARQKGAGHDDGSFFIRQNALRGALVNSGQLRRGAEAGERADFERLPVEFAGGCRLVIDDGQRVIKVAFGKQLLRLRKGALFLPHNHTGAPKFNSKKNRRARDREHDETENYFCFHPV